MIGDSHFRRGDKVRLQNTKRSYVVQRIRTVSIGQQLYLSIGNLPKAWYVAAKFEKAP